MMIMVATVFPKPSHVDDVRRVMLDAAPRVQHEPGCRLGAVHEAPGKFVLIEEWADEAALAAHAGSLAVTELLGRLDGLVDGEVGIDVLTPLPTGDPDRGTIRP
ncbi:antibiotic biosynthesis monooxygenase [Frankia sp. CNm7]|uniref:Antibiotic biosynthesis monooxygenase n=1 Tax=Frankia nepalensis TaxID=1836974 RepID=A0A937UKC1_9ACTN|nr:antibiotic biosynthesis monooxygenase [Frankia nepalensis]MBL7500902.1 antibiotic biosynthesis monooxygenase [Frankia nepalensis]MBL7510331.1 antibiotic biosynthesis monooxygenase [Frankia nepalensis]MBL7519135.1 antibiotic biosynthesis monooxygenase [Frankia nepalensis]MBL7626669.1 antibiotic biosynthesis monooxygenase [Frankia nepalensis]